jgi:hypothetical protein
MVNDNGSGNFIHPLIQSGLVDYTTKVVDVTFNHSLVDPSVKPFICKYSFLIDFKLPAGTELLASYFFTQQSIYITEVGFRSKDGVLLSYATFPPFEFNSTAYHLDFMLLVKKPVIKSVPLRFFQEDGCLFVDVTSSGKSLGVSEDQFRINEDDELLADTPIDNDLNRVGLDVEWDDKV